MYALSRSLYRELEPMLTRSAETAGGRADRRRLLAACEGAIQRLVFEPQSYAHPVRSLFREIQHLIRLDAQLRARELVQVHIEAGRTLSARLEAMLRRDCEAFNRKGSPCRREPRPGGRYCPSHRHLEEITLAQTEAQPLAQAPRIMIGRALGDEARGEQAKRAALSDYDAEALGGPLRLPGG